MIPDCADSGGRAGGKGSGEFFGCAYCNEIFPEQRELMVHEKLIHPGLTYSAVPAEMPDREVQLMRKAPTAAISKRIPLSEVARHCTPEDCWVALEGKVYDLTEFMDRHPGGPTSILNSAGKDVSKIFADIHKGVRFETYLRPEAYLGELGVDEELMSDEFWHTLRKARIVEVEEELYRLVPSDDAHPFATAGPLKRATSLMSILQGSVGDGVQEGLRSQLRTLETQKRAALDAEDFERAQQIKQQQEALLGEPIKKHQVPEYTCDSGIPLSEVARHNKPHDCWVALNGAVYEMTDFLKHHPEQRNSILAWAGRDASPVWDKIPGRFPSSTWMSFFMHPDAKLGDVGQEPALEHPRDEQVRQLRKELRRLKGPSEEDIQAAKAAGPRGGGVSGGGGSATEEERFPRLNDVKSAGKNLPCFTRAEVAKQKGPAGGPPGTEPYMILHNKVYDLTPLLGSHPGGDESLLSRAGTDATADFELFDHSEKARVRRDQDLLVGFVVPGEHVDWRAQAAGASGVGGGGASSVTGSLAQQEWTTYITHKATDAAIYGSMAYAYRSFQHSKPLSSLTYSRLLRHLHLIMATGLFGTLASASAASRAEGLLKKRLLMVHKQTGVAMFVALLFRILARARSGIPPRFPGHWAVQAIETQSLRLFYVLLMVIPLSGMANEYFLKWASGNDVENDKNAQRSIQAHKKMGRFFQFVWLPFHLGYTTLYHASRGRGVVRKVSPFI